MNLFSIGAFEIGEVCTKMGGMLQIVGYVITFFKIAIPLLIIALGMFDFGKAVVAEKEDEIKKQTKRLIYRVIGGIEIFLIPNLVLWLFNAFVDDYSQEAENFKTCETCLLHPGNC